jgi:L-threonylcarbamoyladenylate synthase
VSLSRALQELGAGRVVAAATVTFFFILADARAAAAIDAVLDLKRRDPMKGISLLLPTRDAWRDVAATVPEAAEKLADRFWPGPLTIALPARAGLDARLLVGGTVAVRLPGASPAAEIARAFGRPLTATSANLSGTPPMAAAEEVETAFAEAIAAGRLWVMPGRAPGGAASTLVAVDGGRAHVLRPGAVGIDAIEAVVPVV